MVSYIQLFHSLTWVLSALAAPALQIPSDPPVPIEQPVAPTSTPTPGDEGLSPAATSVTTQIFEVVFPADTFSEALTAIFMESSRREAGRFSEEAGQVQSILDTVLKPPELGYFAAVAASGIRTAAALAPVLFVLRLVLHHWHRLLGEADGVVNVLGDWLIAGFSAVAAGPFLDQLVRTGWWAAGTALGETAMLAGDFLSVATAVNALHAVPIMGRPSLFSAVFVFGMGMGGLLGMVGLVFAFAAAQAVLFILAVLAPVIAVLAVLPQMRWMRVLWLKAAGILILLPAAAGAVFKAAVVLAGSFGGSSFVHLLIRLCWLWGAVGFLLSMAGVLGRFTLSAAVDTAGQLTAGVRSLVSVALLASGGGTGAVSARAAAAGVSQPGVTGTGPPAYAAAIAPQGSAAPSPAARASGMGTDGLSGPALYSSEPPLGPPPEDGQRTAEMYYRPSDQEGRAGPTSGNEGMDPDPEDGEL